MKNNNTGKLDLSSLLSSPRYFSVLYPAVIMADRGPITGLTVFRGIMGNTYYKVYSVLTRKKDSLDINSILRILDSYILDPSIRRTFLRLLQNNLESRELKKYVDVKPSIVNRVLRVIEHLDQVYSLFEKLYYYTIRDPYELSIFLRVPMKGIVYTEGLLSRAKWFAELVSHGNSLIISGPEFSGRRTHLYMTARILMSRYNYPVINIYNTVSTPRRIPLIYSVANIRSILQLRDKLFLTYTEKIDPSILEDFLKDKLVVIEQEEIGRQLQVHDKIILIRASNGSLYTGDELHKISFELDLPETNDLYKLHVMEAVRRAGLSEEYDDLRQLIKRLISRFFFTGRTIPLYSMIYAANTSCGLVTRGVVEVIDKVVGGRGSLGEALVRLAPRTYGLPHPSWGVIINDILAGIEYQEILKRFNELYTALIALKTSIAIKTKNSYEAIATALCMHEAITNLCKKGFNKLILVSPVHYLDESISLDIVKIKNKLSTIGIKQEDLYSIINEYVMAKQYVSPLGLEIDKYFELVNNQIINPGRNIEEIFRILATGEKTPILYVLTNFVKCNVPPDLLAENYEKFPIFFIQALGEEKAAIIFKNPTPIIEKVARRDEGPLALYLTGRIQQLERKMGNTSLYYKLLASLKLHDYKKAKSLAYRLIVKYEELIRKGYTEYLVPICRAYEALIWILLSEGNMAEVERIYKEYTRIMDSHGILLSPMNRNRITASLAIIDHVMNNRIIDNPTEPWMYFANAYIASRRNEKNILEPIANRINEQFTRINIFNAKYLADTAILLLKNNVPIKIDKLLQEARKKGKINPYIAYQYLRIINSYLYYLLRNNMEPPSELTSIISRLGLEAKDFGNWALLLLSIIYRRLGLLWMKKPRRARKYFEESIRILKDISEFDKDFLSNQLNTSSLWLEISKIMTGDYETCYDNLKKLKKHFIKGLYGLLTTYWFTVCLEKNGMYRTGYETVNELFMIEKKDPYRKIIFASLAYRLASRIHVRLKNQYLKLMVDEIRKLPTNRVDQRLISRIMDLSSYAISIGEINDAKILMEAFINKIISNKENIRIISKNMEVVYSLIELLHNLREAIDETLMNRFMGLISSMNITDERLAKNTLISLIITGRLEEAGKYLKKSKKVLSKDEYKSFEMILHYRSANYKKAYKTASKIKKVPEDPYLASWLYYIRAKSMWEKGKRDEAIDYYTRITGSSEKRISQDIRGEAHLRTAEYLIDKKRFIEAYSHVMKALNIYEKQVFGFRKLNKLETLSHLLRYAAIILRNISSYSMAQKIEREICTRLERYRKRLHPQIFHQFFSEIEELCTTRYR